MTITIYKATLLWNKNKVSFLENKFKDTPKLSPFYKTRASINNQWLAQPQRQKTTIIKTHSRKKKF